MAAKLVADGAVPGIAIVVVHADEVVYLGGFGLREVGKPETVDADTVFQLASMSKPISATVVAKLVSDGVVGWDSRIADLNPAFQLHDPYPDRRGDRHRPASTTAAACPAPAATTSRRSASTARRSAQRLRLVPPSSSFRAGYAYSNAGLTQGRARRGDADRAALGEVAEERLYRPLGMAVDQLAPRRLRGAPQPRRRCTSPWQGGWAALATREPDAQAPAGGVSSTVRDLAQWMRLELGNGDWRRRAVHRARTRSPRPTSRCSTAATTRSAAAPPSTAAAGTWSSAGTACPGAMPAPSAPARAPLVTLYPDAGLGIVVLTNAFPTGVPEGIADSFFDLVFDGSVSQGLGGGLGRACSPACSARRSRRPRPTYASPPQPPTPALPAASYVGSYGNDYVGEATVTADGETLTVRARAGRRHRLAADPLRPRHLPLLRRAGDARHAVGRPLRRRPGRPRHRADPRVARLRTASGH